MPQNLIHNPPQDLSDRRCQEANFIAFLCTLRGREPLSALEVHALFNDYCEAKGETPICETVVYNKLTTYSLYGLCVREKSTPPLGEDGKLLRQTKRGLERTETKPRKMFRYSFYLSTTPDTCTSQADTHMDAENMMPTAAAAPLHQ